MARCRTCGLVAIVALAIALSAACREGESPQVGDTALDEPASSAQLAPVVNAPPAPTEPPASPASGQSSSGAALETVEDLLTPDATLLGIQSIVEQGKDGQPGRIVSVQRMRLGDAMVRGDWASQDLSRRDDPDDSVWEVEVANVVIGHSCRIGATPEQCNWDHLILVIHATTGETIGLRYPDSVPPEIPPVARLRTAEDAIARAHDFVPGQDGEAASVAGIWLLTPTEAGLGVGWGESTPVWQVEMEGGEQVLAPCSNPAGVDANCPADHIMLQLHAITGEFLGYRLLEPPIDPTLVQSVDPGLAAIGTAPRHPGG